VQSTAWWKDLRVTADGTGVVLHGGTALLRMLADRAGDVFQPVPTDTILVEQFAAVGESRRCLGKLLGRQAVVVNFHVDVASVERAANKRDVKLHKVIFAGVPCATQTIGQNAVERPLATALTVLLTRSIERPGTQGMTKGPRHGARHADQHEHRSIRCAGTHRLTTS
jgi:hypothetical protein